jgi:hypothetical protein
MLRRSGSSRWLASLAPSMGMRQLKIIGMSQILSSFSFRLLTISVGARNSRATLIASLVGSQPIIFEISITIHAIAQHRHRRASLSPVSVGRPCVLITVGIHHLEEEEYESSIKKLKKSQVTSQFPHKSPSLHVNELSLLPYRNKVPIDVLTDFHNLWIFRGQQLVQDVRCGCRRNPLACMDRSLNQNSAIALKNIK